MANNRAPKQWALTKVETINTFENWRQNILYTLSLDANFAPYLIDGVQWAKRTPAAPLRGFINDDEEIAENRRRTAAQKVNLLELLLGQIANYAPIVSRNTIVISSTSIASIWQALRLHYGFQSTGAHFLDFDSISLQSEERAEDLYQRLIAFIDDSMLRANGGITHHGEQPADETLSPTLENVVVLTWLRLLHPSLPKLVKQRYGTELRSRTLASLKPEISQALESLLDELRNTEDAKVLRSAVREYKSSGSSRGTDRPSPSSNAMIKRKTPYRQTTRQCPICKASGRPLFNHFLSSCKFLPESDRQYLTKARQIFGAEHDDDQFDEDDDLDQEDDQLTQSVNNISLARRVHIQSSPTMKVYSRHHPLCLTLDSGAETNMIKAATAKYIGAKIEQSSQTAIQADGETPLTILGEIHITVSRNGRDMALDALVVEEMDSEILAGIPFMEENDIALRPACKEICIGGIETFKYNTNRRVSPHNAVRRAQVVRAPPSGATIWPGEYIELPIPSEYDDCEIALEPRYANHHNPRIQWLCPNITETVGGRIRIVNSSSDPIHLPKNEHFCQVLHTIEANTQNETSPIAVRQASLQTKDVLRHSVNVNLDPDNLLSPELRNRFHSILTEYDSVFDPKITGYNGAVGPFQAIVNMGPTQPPQRKGRVPQYARNKLVELQAKFDELENLGVFRRPEDLDIVAEYVNPSFLIKKASGGYRLVTAFADVGRYCKPTPSLMQDVDTTLRSIARWKYIVTTDLTSAFYQIPLSKDSMKYCGVVTPFRGVRIYTRSAMGMPGSETALEELTCRVLGDLLEEGVVAKLADDLYCGGSTPTELLHNWTRVLQALDHCNLRLSAHKTTICPKSTTILGWIWSFGTLHASPHRIATLSTCKMPETVRGLRSFIGAYKAISRVLPGCAQFVSPLDSAIAGCQSQELISWTEALQVHFNTAQKALSSNKRIALPIPTDQLWIVTDGSVKNHGIGSTLYVTRSNKPTAAGFFSAKLRKHQVTWLPCEIEALGIAAAVKHFAPFIIQSECQTCLLTDSKPCVQAFEKLCRGEFSASPRVTSFLSTASRYQVTIRHLAGSANIPSDFASRNAPDCNDHRCQICTFITTTEDSVIRTTSVQDVLDGALRLPFTTRSTWLATQSECPDLRRVHAHLKQGTRPSKKLTNIRDVKRYLHCVTIARDGLLVVRRPNQLTQIQETIVIPRQVVSGLLTALHIKLDHPSRHQLKLVFHRHFYALDMDKIIEEVSQSCHACAALRKVPDNIVAQSSEDPPDAIGISFAADVIKRHRQLILVLRETVTSFTSSLLIDNECHDTLRSALACLCSQQTPLDGPNTVIRVDPAPGFMALSDDKVLRSLHISLEIGRIKNKNKNPVAEKAIAELLDELLRQEPGNGPVTPLQLALATARLNSRIRSRGLSSREMMFQRNQFTNESLPISDRDLITAQHRQRTINHPFSERSKSSGHVTPLPHLSVGDIVYLSVDKSKLQPRARYLIVSIDGPWCFIRKFAGAQLRSTSYKVKLSECYCVPSFDHNHLQPVCEGSDEEYEATTPDYLPPPEPPATPDIITNPLDISIQVSQPDTIHISSPSLDNTLEDTCASPTDISPNPTSCTPSSPLNSRPQRIRKPPGYLTAYDLSG